MPFSRWLRARSEHYLLIAAQEQMARRYETRAPMRPSGAGELFWRRVFAPLYRVLPWRMRHRIMLAMPGSHRQLWAPAPRSQGPAALFQSSPATSTRQEREIRDGADRG